MMSPSESYLASIADHVPYDELDAVEADIEREEGPAALFRCLEARLAAEVERGGSAEAILDTRSRLASAGERASFSQEDASAIQVSLQTFEIWREVGDDEGCGRAACRALELALHAREQIPEVIDALGGHEKALFWIRKNLRSKAIKKSPEKNAQVRHLAARMLEQAGEAEAAFLELLGAVRKMPSDTTYIDEVYRLALDTVRHEELIPIFSDIASDDTLTKEVRATIFLKIGYLEERCAERPDRALEAFRTALALRPKHKGSKRHVKRLEDRVKKEASANPQTDDESVAEPEPAVEESSAAPPMAPPADDESAATNEDFVATDVNTAPLSEEMLAETVAVASPPALPTHDDESADFEDAGDLDVLEEAPRVPSSESVQAKMDAAAAASGALPPPLPSFEAVDSDSGEAEIEPAAIPAAEQTASPKFDQEVKENANEDETEVASESATWVVADAQVAFEDASDVATLHEGEAISVELTDESISVVFTDEQPAAVGGDDDTTAENQELARSEEFAASNHDATDYVDNLEPETAANVDQDELSLLSGAGENEAEAALDAIPPTLPEADLEELEAAEISSIEDISELDDEPQSAEPEQTNSETDSKSFDSDDMELELLSTDVLSELEPSVADENEADGELEASAALSGIEEMELASALDSALDDAINEAVGEIDSYSAETATTEAELANGVPDGSELGATQEHRLSEDVDESGLDATQEHPIEAPTSERDEGKRAQALAKLTARLPGGAATRRLLSKPTDALLDEGYEFYLDTRPEELVELPFSVRILFAIALLRRGEAPVALEILERLVQEQPTDLLCLRALSDALEGNDERIEERLEAVRNLLLHHKRVLSDADILRYRATTGALQWRLGERENARITLHQALVEAEDEQLQDAMTDEVASAAVAALVDAEDSSATEPAVRVLALRYLADHRSELARAEVLEKAANIAAAELDDVPQSRALLLQAVEAFPEGRSAPASLMELDIQEGDVDAAVATTKALLLTENEPEKRGFHHLRLAELLISTQTSADEIHTHLCGAVEFDAVSDAAIELAERYYRAAQNLDGLHSFYVDAAALSSIGRERRLHLWRKVVELRRDVFSDLEGCAEALEHVARLDTGSIQPREECARIYMKLGRFKEAVATWRAILERAPLAKRAWRGLFGAYVSYGRGDEAFAVAAAMSSIELADEAMMRAVRLSAPEFPCWPQVPSNPMLLRQRLSHPLETPLLRQIFEEMGGALHQNQAASLKDFGLRKRDELTEKTLPPSVVGAAKRISAMMGLPHAPSLFVSPHGSADGRGADFALLPVAEPSLLVSDDVLQNGMTPERAFAMGRAMAWLAPQSILAGTMAPPQLLELLEGLVELLLGNGRGQGDAARLKAEAARLDKALFVQPQNNTKPVDREALTKLVAEYETRRDRIHLVDWIAGVGYSADRFGFLLVGDVTPATRVIKSTAGDDQMLGARLAIKELVLFSASSVYLSLRQQLGLALSEKDAKPILRLR